VSVSLSSLLTQTTPVQAASGGGAVLTDLDGPEDLDFTSGIGVNSTGYCHPRVVVAAQEQVATLIHGQYTTVMQRAARAAAVPEPTRPTPDPAGNHLTAPGHSYSHSADGQLCQIDTSGVCPADPATWQITYDDAGRTAKLSGWAFAYDTDGRLVSACQSASCTGSEFNRVDYTYDGEGVRARFAVAQAATRSTPDRNTCRTTRRGRGHPGPRT
jgi:hypothetical protein